MIKTISKGFVLKGSPHTFEELLKHLEEDGFYNICNSCRWLEFWFEYYEDGEWAGFSCLNPHASHSGRNPELIVSSHEEINKICGEFQFQNKDDFHFEIECERDEETGK